MGRDTKPDSHSLGYVFHFLDIVEEQAVLMNAIRFQPYFKGQSVPEYPN